MLRLFRLKEMPGSLVPTRITCPPFYRVIVRSPLKSSIIFFLNFEPWRVYRDEYLLPLGWVFCTGAFIACNRVELIKLTPVSGVVESRIGMSFDDTGVVEDVSNLTCSVDWDRAVLRDGQPDSCTIKRISPRNYTVKIPSVKIGAIPSRNLIKE